jgi:hypothetical protein
MAKNENLLSLEGRGKGEGEDIEFHLTFALFCNVKREVTSISFSTMVITAL